MSEAQKQKRER